MEGNYLRFYENYGGKLDKNVFTTIRPDDPDRFQAGQLYNIYLGDEKLYLAMMIRVTPIQDLRKLDPNIIKVDTGIENRDEFIELMEKFYGNVDEKNWVLLALKRV